MRAREPQNLLAAVHRGRVTSPVRHEQAATSTRTWRALPIHKTCATLDNSLAPRGAVFGVRVDLAHRDCSTWLTKARSHQPMPALARSDASRDRHAPAPAARLRLEFEPCEGARREGARVWGGGRAKLSRLCTELVQPQRGRAARRRVTQVRMEAGRAGPDPVFERSAALARGCLGDV